ncbi:hypothetical protein 8F9_19 [uncultured Caudovirales phage]|uniref:Uncharacterized protein n=2 Tax=uncultured Caudovirales phage TaxID=2100421 RepID=A0A2H4JC75_9CAUD|nr:hypothetical protein [Pseudomonas sp. NBRC 111137]ASN70666.1 hypothetical protein 2AX5_36 [uncultured Caudovirales phage]ASN70702.1 hypothetical protein 9AX3_19 [uncultured Caudovirales phage]ASN70738.1 hypothetical protein 10AX4_2 [uncultured Caudovirales phage]ASN70827.1 hypothetical protein 9S2_41 [uncultured Caudovirales phage]ASN70885.1 hypothetical protein 8S2_49 [uncultured Caudovirales phage]
MHHQNISVMLCFLALGALISFSQTSKHMTIGPYSAFLSWLIIPAGVAILWKLGSIFGWWTILIFIVVSLFVGTLNAVTARSMGRELLYSMQPILGTVFLLGAIAAWVAPLI